MERLTAINQEIFAFNETSQILLGVFQRYKNVLICLAVQGDRTVGFKIGVLDMDGSFDSWRGGVITEFRRQGIALKMMRTQHEWCVQNKVKVITTTTNSDNSAMLILNLQNGFEIAGCFVNRRKRLKILQKKWL